MRRPDPSRRQALLTWLFWTAGFLAFPVAGVAGTAVAGPVDGPLAALAGGAVAGLVIGAGQTLASRRRLGARTWIPPPPSAWGSDCSSALQPSSAAPRWPASHS